jgi:methylornithine synthase
MRGFPFCSLNNILDKVAREESLSRSEILYLLGLDEDGETERLFEIARRLRARYFGDKIFLYGFLYFSTWCRNHCTFCYYRASNKFCKRYRRTEDEILEAAIHLAESGVHLLDLTMGEDPLYFDEEDGFTPLLALVRKIKRETGLPTMISFGVIPNDVLKKLPDAGADWYACYQETHDRALFRRLRPNQDYDARLQIKQEAFRLGLLVEEGILHGVGESLTDIAHSIDVMKKMGAHQVRIMNFVPQRGTPMSHFPPPDRKRELVTIAVLRLLFPHRLIPASLDVYGIAGLREKLWAGANVVTSLIPPSFELSGVAQSTLDIREGYRTVKAVTPILNELGLKGAGVGNYLSWVEGQKNALMKGFHFDRGCLS